MLIYFLLAIAAAQSDRGADIRPLLRAQGFEWTVEKSDARIRYIGDISKAGHTYSVYLYNAVNRDSGHGLNLFIFMLNKSIFLGVHEAGSAHDCHAQKDAVVCKSDFPGRRIQFTDNGPPLMLWFDGYYEKFWFAPKFRRNSDSEIGQDYKKISGNQTVNYFDTDNLKYSPLSEYQKYPESVRLLIRQADIEIGQCRGRFDEHTLYACNRREMIMIELDKRGWCYGGSLVGYELHWLKCADDPYYLPRDAGLNNFYSEEEIREQIELQKR